MNIKLICVGKIKEKYLDDAINEYVKRLKTLCTFQIVEIKEINSSDYKKDLIEEGKNILKNINENDYVITLEIDGKELSSVDFSKLIESHYTYDNKKMIFVIGSSCGLSDEVKSRSNYKLSFSKMTFPHQLMRVIYLEQLYRAFAIINNIKYHK
ncbi:MAG: 23S rRNA (pseudouridine(1915)-N(3))-methyltransferase RlmH [Bacilli bacterium]|nr:23S rRNA (pseudouridine(1915)-N(3))-methyltransferase RlmH [Bacilli bacterium]